TQVLSVQLVALAPRTALFVVVLADGSVEKRTVELDEDADEETLDRARQHVAQHLVGSPLTSLALVPPSVDPSTETVLRQVRGASVDEPVDDHVFVGGAARMVASF